LRLLPCLLLAALCGFAAPGPDPLRAGLALFVLTGALWVTQALPLAVTALAVPLLAVLAGVLSPREALAPFAHPVIFLFLGGFALAAALRRQGLDRALAGVVLRLAGGSRPAAVVLLSALTAVLSMWVSNTATAAMMLPLAFGLLRGDPGTPEPGPGEQAFVLLAVAYGASIGGMGTLVGSPPNAIAAAQAGIGFAQWLGYGLPLVALLWPAMLGVLALMLRPALGGRIVPPTAPIAWTRERVLAVVVFAAAVAGWVGGAPLGRALGIGADVDAMVALVAIVALVATGVLGWADVERETRWGVLLLFGGGLALSEAMGASGASRFLAEAVLAGVRDAPPALLLLGVVAFVVFLTELVSNTASAALLLPVVLPVAVAIGLPPVAAAAAIAVSASCAFMLPVATPPNAIVFATERVPQVTMMRCGLVLNLICIVVIAAMAIWVWR
jgi:sodium-dependent dicarboxylate transporter 2/3/5